MSRMEELEEEANRQDAKLASWNLGSEWTIVNIKMLSSPELALMNVVFGTDILVRFMPGEDEYAAHQIVFRDHKLK